MKIALCYIAVSGGQKTEEYASRFVTTYIEYPPGVEHDTFIICNGGPLDSSFRVIFSGIEAKMWPRVNDPGWDISAYIAAAKGPCISYDMMLCLGESVYFHREGWLKRLVDVWNRVGKGMYGPFSSNAVRGHLNTTAFCTAPDLLRQYPRVVMDRAERYEFEHGEHSLWRTISRRGFPVRLVTWDGDWTPRNWRVPHDILWRGTQANCLMWCNHSDNYANVSATTKAHWMRSCDRPFK